MDNIKVAIRVRPMIAREQKTGCKSNWVIRDNTMAPMENGRVGSPYAFDRIFDQNKTTLDIFDEICKPVITGAVQGFHGTIFAYGQSSSGKTFTMTGSAAHPGIISLSMEEIFKQMKHTLDKEFLLRISYMEIYNEKVSDLLSSEDKPIRIQEDFDKNILLTGVSEELVMSIGDVKHYMDIGNDRKHMAETKQNDRSSRSHCIMRMIIESREMGDEDAVMVSHLNFVDLAGSEKAHENSGDRYKEGCAINKSLFMLGTVISKLSDGVGHQHIGYRDSKLTRILQNALGGNSKTAIIATITPASIEESHSTLRFASRAKTIKNAPHVNETLSDAAMLKRSKKEIQILQKQIEELKNFDAVMQKEEMQRKLEEKMEQERKHKETINKLKQFIIKANSENEEESNFKKLKRRRETWCPGKAKGAARELPGASKFARDLSGQRIDVDFERPPIPKSFVTSRRDENGLADISEIQSLADMSLPKDDSLFTMEFPPKFEDFPKQRQRHVSFKSPQSDTDSFEQEKEFRRLQDKYEDLLQMYEEKCRLSQQDHSYMIHELDCVKEELEKEKSNPTNNQIIDVLKSDLKKIQNEKNDLTDEVVLLQHRLSIQTRKVDECMHELTSLRSHQTDAPKENHEPNDAVEIKRLMSEKDKLAGELSDLKNINEELQHQHETSLEMYIMKVQELEEKIEENDETLKSQKDMIANLSDETKALQTALKDSEGKVSHAAVCQEQLQKEINDFKSSSNDSNDQLDIKTAALDSSKQMISQQEMRIADLEKEILQLYAKLKEHTGVDRPRHSTADELSEVLKEHCVDLENRMKELEMENSDLKEKLEKAVSLAQIHGPRRSTADELSDILKEHCEDLETRLKEMEIENAELKEKLETRDINSESNETLDSCGKDLKELEGKLIEFESENTELKEKLKAVTEETIKSQEKTGQVLEEEMNSLKSKNTELEIIIKELKEENKDLRERHDNTGNAENGDKNNMENKVNSLEKEIVKEKKIDQVTEDALDEINVAPDIKSVADKEDDKLKMHCSGLEQSLGELRNENKELQCKVDKLTEQLSSDEKHYIKALETEKDEIKREFIKLQDTNRINFEKIAHLQLQLVTLGEKVRADSLSENNRRSVEVELTDVYKEHCQDLETRMADVEAENESLLSRIEKLSADSRKVKDLEREIIKLEVENEELKCGQSPGNKNIADEINSTDVGSQQTKSNEEYAQKFEMYVNKIEELESERDDLSQKLEKLLNEKMGSNDGIDMLKKLESQIKLLEDENNILLEKVHENNISEVESLESNIKLLVEDNQCTLQKLEAKEKHCLELESKVEVLEKELQVQDNPQSSGSGTVVDLQCQIDRLEAQNRDLLEQTESSSSPVLQGLEEKIHILENENKSLREKLIENSNAEENSKIETKLLELELENKALSEKLEKNSEKSRNSEVHDESKFNSEEVSSLAGNEDQDSRLGQLMEKNKLLVEKVEVQNALVLELNSKIEVLDGENKTMSERLEEYIDSKTQMQELQDKIIDVENKGTTDVDSCDTKLIELECKVEVLEEENRNLLLKLEEFKDRELKFHELPEKNSSIEMDEAKLVELQCKVDVLEEENKALIEKLQENEQSHSQVQELQDKIQELETKSTEDMDSDKDVKIIELECKVEVLEEENKTLLKKIEHSEGQSQIHPPQNQIIEHERQSNENGDEAKILELECKIEVLEEENKNLTEKFEQFNDSHTQIDELQEKIKDLEQQNYDLNQKGTGNDSFLLKELQCQIEALDAEKVELVDKLQASDISKELQNRIDILEETNKDLERKLVENTEYNENNFMDEVESLKEKNQQLSDTIEKGKIKVKEFMCKIDSLQEENQCLTKKLQESNDASTKLSEGNEENDELKTRIDVLLESIETLEVEKQVIKDSNESLIEKVVGLETKCEQVESELNMKSDELEAVLTKLTESECKVEVLQEEMDTMYKKVDNMVDRSKYDETECKAEVLQEENDALSKKLQELEEHYQISKHQEVKLGDLSSEAQNLKNEKDKLASELEDVRFELSKVTKLKDRADKKITDLKDDIEIIKATEQILKNDNDLLMQEVSTLHKKYQEQVQAEKERSEGLVSEIDTLKQTLTDMISNEDLQQKLTEIDLIWKEKLQKKQDTVDKQLETLSVMKGDKDKIEQDLRTAESEKLEVMEKCHSAEKEVRELNGKLEKLQKDYEERQMKLKSLENGNMNESMNTSKRMEHLDIATKERIVKLVTENNKLKERTTKDSKLIEIQQNSIQRLEEELEKKDRSNDLYDKLKEAEKEQKKAEEDADKYYNQFCDEEAKVSKLRDEIRQRNVEIHKLKQDIDGMESQGFVKKDEKAQEEFRMLKKRFTETYNQLQEAKRTVSNAEKEVGDKKLRILVLEGTVRDNEEKHQRELKAYVESYEMLEERIREYKDKIRELENQKCQDDTISNFNAIKKENNMPIGRASSAGGAVDHFNNILLQEENRKLLQKVTKYEKKVEKLMIELQRYQKDKKENQELEKKVLELREEEKKLRSQIDEHQRAPLENVNTGYDNYKMNPKFTPTQPTPIQKPKKRTNDVEEGCAQQ